MKTGFAEYAQKYYEMGFSIMPVEGKLPIVEWKKYQTQRPTQEEIDHWIDIYPDKNIGIITGKVSDIVVVDVDGPEGMEALKGKHLPETLIAKTGRGMHYYFKMPPDRTIGNAVGILPKVDIRGEGGYVVAPGSIHESGAIYKWLIDDDPADCPFWVYEEHAKDKASRTKAGGNAPDWVEDIKKGVGKGQRNQACAKLAGYYVQKNYEADDIEGLLVNWNQRNRPPLPEKELQATLNSILQRDPNTNSTIKAEACTLEKAKEVLNRWLYYKDDTIIDVSLAVLASNNHPSDPLWVVIVGGSSTGKTETLRALQNHQDTYFLDSITPATFVTGFTKAKGLLERMGPDPKTFILQDLSTIISKPPYDRMQILDHLRQIYNGQLYAEWGNGKKFSWKGRVSLVAACTPEIESHGIAMGELGERFLYYRIDADDEETRMRMMIKARAMEGHERRARKEIAEALHGVITECRGRDIASIHMPDTYYDWLMPMVDLTTALRSPVKRNAYRREIIEYTPHKEGPGRMYKACQVLMKSLAVVRGRKEVNDDDYAVVIKVCLDSIPSVRREAMRGLVKISKDGGGGLRAKQVARLTGYQSTESVGYHLADLSALGIVRRWLGVKNDGSIGTNAPWLYELEDKTLEKLEKCGMIDMV